MFDGTMRKKVGDRQIDSFSIFKKGIKPEWEAPENAQGGEWQSRSKMAPQALDLFWASTLGYEMHRESMYEGCSPMSLRANGDGI